MVLKTLEGTDAIVESIQKCRPQIIAGMIEQPVEKIVKRLEKDCSVHSSARELVAYLKAAALSGVRSIGIMSGSDLPVCSMELASIATNHIPLVLLVANRSSYFPTSFMCDQQGAYQVSSSGWIMLFCSTLQEFVDTLPQAFKVSSATGIPVMIFVDGFYHTHQTTQINIAPQETFDKYLQEIAIKPVLDFNSRNLDYSIIGEKDYEKRMIIFSSALENVKERITQAEYQWNDLVERQYGNGLFEGYMLEDADMVLVCSGSFFGNAHEAADRQRKMGIKAGVLRIKCFRPFPYEEIGHALENKKIGVMERAVSLGSRGMLYLDLLEVVGGLNNARIVGQFAGGIGGTDLNVKHARLAFEAIAKGEKVREIIEGN